MFIKVWPQHLKSVILDHVGTYSRDLEYVLWSCVQRLHQIQKSSCKFQPQRKNYHFTKYF